jgi:hypothetical protein
VPDGVIGLALSAIALLVPVAWTAWRVAREPADSPARLVGQLRLAQQAALVLVFLAAVHAGMAILQLDTLGAGLELALAVGFLVLASTTMLREPPEALTWLALALLAHAALDVLHRPGLLPPALVPGWYARDCATFSVLLAALCYLPLRRRRG